jgi:hypothetical protein
MNGNAGSFELLDKEAFPRQEIANVIVEPCTIQEGKRVDQEALGAAEPQSFD